MIDSMPHDILHDLLIGKDLSPALAKRLTTSLFTAKASEEFTRSSLLLLRKKGETAGELVSLVRFLRRHAVSLKVDLPFLTDFCGTGGDEKNTFNISTLAALVAAGAGAYVVKHGNRSVSSHCGSSDLVECLGVKLKLNARQAEQILRHAHFVYLHAPFFHPLFARVQPVRQSLKTKSVFNFLGPLLNPAGVKHQIIGVSDASLLQIYPKILSALGTRHIWVIMSEDGYDEISLTGRVRAVQIRSGRFHSRMLHPGDFGLKRIHARELTTKNLHENTEIAKKILSGREEGPKRDVVLANAALGLVASGRAQHLREGMALARFSLETGRASEVLKRLVEFSQ